MPTTYAHWRFGCDCIGTLPENLQKIVNENRELFDIGVHGPDIFFYDLTHKKLTTYGNRLHNQPARIFFNNCVEVYNSNQNDKDAMLAYILGFLSHYAFDSQAHGYIDRKKEVSGLSHNKVESEYDGHLMRLDGRSIPDTDRAESLRPNKHRASIIARFFPFTTKEILRTCKAHHTIIAFLVCRKDLKRKSLGRIFRGISLSNFADLLVQPKELPECKDSNMRLDKLRANALKLYPEIVDEFMNALDGKEFSAYFEHDFEPWPDYQEIPVLDPEAEEKFVPELRK